MNNKINIKEDIEILENKVNEFRYMQNTLAEDEKESYADDIQEAEIQAIENILADRERLEKENAELKNKVSVLRKRPVFYYDNNKNRYVWCCRCTDSNMSLHMFLENGEIQQYASEHYDQWVENAKEVKQVDVCELMHKFVKPLIVKANAYDSLVEKIEEIRNDLEKDGFVGYADELQELLDAEK